MEILNERKQFDKSADIYDKFRPGYPDEIFKAMLFESGIKEGGRILEVGSGSGKATASIAPLEYEILCVDPGENLIRIGNKKFKEYPNVRFTKGYFEELSFPEKYYDIVFSAQAFHWVKKPEGYINAAEALKDGGSLCLIWNMYITYENQTDKKLLSLSEKYGGFADFLSPKGCEERIQSVSAEIEGSGVFTAPHIVKVLWEQSYSAEEYCGFLLTGNKFIQKSKEEQNAAFSDISALCEKHGGKIKRPYLSVLYVSKKRQK